jgi:DNA-binding transcriptional ArsR family regulator
VAGVTETTELPDLARLLASPARATMLAALLDGRALPAGELGRTAGVAASTASEHLAALADAGLVTVLSTGRHRYYRLADATVAATLEAWFRLAPPAPPRSLRASKQARSLAFARTCYDHLAGRLGVAVHAALLDREWLAATTDGYDVAPIALAAFRSLGADVDAASAAAGPLARPCLDWTERRHHLAGPLAVQLCRTLVSDGWLRRAPGGRGLVLTERGGPRLRDALGVDVRPADAVRVG